MAFFRCLSVTSLVTASVVVASPAGSLQRDSEAEEHGSIFSAYHKRHSRDYKHGTEEYEMRKALFEQRLAEVDTHNSNPDKLWQAGTSHFTDRTEGERQEVRGYKRTENPSHGFSMLEISSPEEELPEEKNWMHLAVANKVRDQGACGSCWAVATVTVLEAHYEIYSAKGGATKSFSPQQTLECTPNPNECGGQGGCKGATVELALDWIVKNGLATEDEVPYQGVDGQCSAKKVLLGQDAAPADQGGASFGLQTFKTLTPNADYPLAEALAKYGPVAISASAGAWFEYNSGVFDGCQKDAVVDHAITAYGYGKDKDVKYWLVRNSWGASWGEKGFIRIKRLDKHCGTDNKPSEGTGCKGGPASVTVCGMCGMLYDSVVPYFAGSPGHASAASPAAPAAVTAPSGPLAVTAQLDAQGEVDPRFAEPEVQSAHPSMMRYEAKRH